MLDNGKSIKRRFISNTIWIIAERVLQMLISLVVGMMSVRYLGPENYGAISYTGSFLALFNSICTLGLEGIIIKNIVDEPDKSGEIIGTSIVMRIISSTLSIIGILIMVYLTNPNEKMMLSLALLQSIGLIFMSFEVIDFWFQANLNSKFSSIAKGIGGLVVAAWKMFLLITQKSIYYFAATTTIQYVVVAIILAYLYYQSDAKKLTVCLKRGKTLISQSYHFILSGMIVVLYTQMDKIMIGQMIDTKQVGIYTTAVSIPGLYAFIFYAIINSSRAIILETRKKDYASYIKRIKQLYAVLLWVNIAIFICLLVFNKMIIYVLYGKQYMAGAPILVIAGCSNIFAILGSARGIWIVGEEKYKYTKKYLFHGAIVNLVLNSYMIPRMGIMGAAIATLITQIIVVVVSPMFYKSTRVHSRYIWESFILKDVMPKKGEDI